MTELLLQERDRLRRTALTLRDRMPPPQRDAASHHICRTVMALPVVTMSKVVFGYCHFRSEVETSELLAACLAASKTVGVPCCRPDRNEMLAVAITDPLTELAPGYLGIPEPLPALLNTCLLEPAAIEVAMIPGAVFDRSGHRLGYGMGCYDRFLVHAPRSVRIGLAFSGQMVDRLPTLEHDVPMDMVVTEREVLTWPGRVDATNSRL